MHGDEAVRQSPHSIAQNVARGGLHDVLDELRTVAFQPFPLLRAAGTLVGDAVSSELVCADFRFHIGQLPPGGQGDKEHPAFIAEVDTAHIAIDMLLDGVHGCAVHVPPELSDIRVGGDGLF